MSDPSALLRRLAEALAAEPHHDPLSWRLCHASRRLLGVDGASITLENATPDRVTLCATDDRSSALENLQDVLTEGPCVDAFRHDHSVHTLVDVAAARRWPRFIPAAADVVGEQGALWSVPMHANGEVIGALSLYRLTLAPLGEEGETVQFLADTVALTVAHDPAGSIALSDARDWGSRAQVHQATGMLIGQLGLRPDDALALLRAYAYASAIPLRDVARDVIARRLDLTDS